MAQTVLLVDDEPMQRTLITAVLERAGFEVITAEDGLIAVDRLKEREFKAVVSDLLMPAIDGFSLIEYLKQTNPAMLRRLIVITGLDDRYLQGLDRNEVFAVLRKPVDQKKLAELVKQLMD